LPPIFDPIPAFQWLELHRELVFAFLSSALIQKVPKKVLTLSLSANSASLLLGKLLRFFRSRRNSFLVNEHVDHVICHAGWEFAAGRFGRGVVVCKIHDSEIFTRLGLDDRLGGGVWSLVLARSCQNTCLRWRMNIHILFGGLVVGLHVLIFVTVLCGERLVEFGINDMYACLESQGKKVLLSSEGDARRRRVKVELNCHICGDFQVNERSIQPEYVQLSLPMPWIQSLRY
jgi:hypothetical protein